MITKTITNTVDYYCNGKCNACRVKHLCTYIANAEDELNNDTCEILCDSAFAPSPHEKAVLRRIMQEAKKLDASKNARKLAHARIEGMLLAYELLTGVHAVFDQDERVICEGNSDSILYEEESFINEL